MKILFAIQATGNGHISRAKEIYPELVQYGTVDILLSGVQAEVDPGFPVKYQLYGLSFIFGKKGGVSVWKTFRSLRLIRLIRDICQLDIHQYDLVISDYEPVSVWAGKLRKKKVYGLSHQSAVLHPQASGPLFEKDWYGQFILNHYAICDQNIGFYTRALDDRVFPAVIRSEVRQLDVNTGNKVVVYLPSYANETFIHIFRQLPEAEWLVFSKHTQVPLHQENVHIRPIQNEAYLLALAAARAVLMGAGFEGPCEALFLKKKLMVVPMKGQYEQQCNAAAFVEIGVPAIPELSEKYIAQIKDWLHKDQSIACSFPADTAGKAVQKLMEIAALPAIRKSIND